MDPSLKPSGSQTMQLSASILPNKKRIGRYEVIRLLGRGAFGTVKLGLDCITGNNVAIKILKHRNVQCERDFEMIDREKKALMLLDHPNIVKLLEIIEDEDKDATYLVFEYVGGGELFNYIVSKGRLAEPRARKFVRQIVSALEYCHYNLIVHRDLKPENLLLDENDNIKITDFGLANFITPNKFQTFCGSLHYAAPEILRSHAYGGPPVDIYALGIVLYCLVNGRQPFDAESAHDMVKKINQGLQYHAEVSKELRDLISRMLTVDPKKRITLAEVRMHPWIQDCRGPPPSYVPKIEPVTEIDEEIMKELVSLGFKDKPSTRHAIMKNKDKQVVSAYHLCRNRRKDTRERSRSVAQISKISLASSSTSLGRLRRASVSNATGIPFITSHVKRSQMGQGGTASVADLKARHQVADPDKRKSDHTGIAGPSPSEISATTQSDSSSKTLEDVDNLLETIANNAKPMVFMRKTSRRQTTEIPYSPRQSQTTDALFPFPQQPENDQSSDKKTDDEIALEPVPVTAPVPTPVPVLPLDSPTVRINSPSKKRELTSSGQFRCDTTTTKRTKDIKKHIATTALKCAMECEKVSRYSFKLHKQEVQVVFDIEIVKMKDFKNLKGLKFKRLEGDIWQYKQVVTEFADWLRL